MVQYHPKNYFQNAERLRRGQPLLPGSGNDLLSQLNMQQQARLHDGKLDPGETLAKLVNSVAPKQLEQIISKSFKQLGLVDKSGKFFGKVDDKLSQKMQMELGKQVISQMLELAVTGGMPIGIANQFNSILKASEVVGNISLLAGNRKNNNMTAEQDALSKKAGLFVMKASTDFAKQNGAPKELIDTFNNIVDEAVKADNVDYRASISTGYYKANMGNKKLAEKEIDGPKKQLSPDSQNVGSPIPEHVLQAMADHQLYSLTRESEALGLSGLGFLSGNMYDTIGQWKDIARVKQALSRDRETSFGLSV